MKHQIGILFGPNGAGKGTVAHHLGIKFDYIHVNIGNYLREWVKTNEHKQYQKILNNGEMLPDEIVHDVLFSKFHEYKARHHLRNMLFDGFPRRKTQIPTLEKLCEEFDLDLRWVLMLNVSLEEILERLEGRVLAPDGKVYHLTYNPPPAHFTQRQLRKRKDDRPDIVKKRYENYVLDTLECLSDPFFKNAQIGTIDATKSIIEVYKQTEEFLKDIEAI